MLISNNGQICRAQRVQRILQPFGMPWQESQRLQSAQGNEGADVVAILTEVKNPADSLKKPLVSSSPIEGAKRFLHPRSIACCNHFVPYKKRFPANL